MLRITGPPLRERAQGLPGARHGNNPSGNGSFHIQFAFPSRSDFSTLTRIRGAGLARQKPEAVFHGHRATSVQLSPHSAPNPAMRSAILVGEGDCLTPLTSEVIAFTPRPE